MRWLSGHATGPAEREPLGVTRDLDADADAAAVLIAIAGAATRVDPDAFLFRKLEQGGGRRIPMPGFAGTAERDLQPG